MYAVAVTNIFFGIYAEVVARVAGSLEAVGLPGYAHCLFVEKLLCAVSKLLSKQ